jgi:hypothetical protein
MVLDNIVDNSGKGNSGKAGINCFLKTFDFTSLVLEKPFH